MISLLRSTFNTLENRVLLVGAERAILYLFEGGELAHAYIFSADDAGMAMFDRALEELPDAPVCVLVDVVEEEYRQDTIPHVSGADRRAVLARKYARLFRGTVYHHALAQGRETEGRRDDRVLLTAITRPEVVKPWIDLLLAHKVPVPGIYSLPILGERLLKRIGATGPNVLLISLQKASGLRQSFFRDGQLKISRLAYMPRLGSVPFAAHLMGEVEKLRRYLNSLALISRDGPLSVYILSQGRLMMELEQHCRDTELEKFFLLEVGEVERRLGLRNGGETHYADLVFAKLLAGRAPRNHYASSEQTQFYALHRARVGLATASVVLLLGGAGWSGINFIEGVTFRQQAIDAAQKAAFYQERYEIARQKLPPTPVEPRSIKTAVDAVEALGRVRTRPEPVLRTLSAALGALPRVRLDGLDWKVGQAPEAVRPDDAGSRWHVAEFSGHLEPFDGDYRGAIAVIDALAERLRARDGVASVRVLQYPLDVRSEASVSGSTTAPEQRAAADFRMELVMGADRGRHEG